jgi:hypothetical protein
MHFRIQQPHLEHYLDCVNADSCKMLHFGLNGKPLREGERAWL